MREKQTNKKTILLAVTGFLVLALLMTAAYVLLRPETSAGAKTVHIAVVTAQTKTYDLHTDAEYLRQALEEENLIAGAESAFGLFVQTVDGVTADAATEWWCFTQDGEMLFTGVDDTPVRDGDSFEITLTPLD